MYERASTWGLVPLIPQSVFESPKVTTRTAGAVPDIVVVQTRFDPGEVAAPPPALARTW
ncbi:MAG: hypothetical protein H0X07_02125 [Gemmatimonadales bacterium]|nr:hypothetical protein [Gemmatimonadales bacterium]